jgi:transposase
VRVQAVIGQYPLSGHLFVFRSPRGERLKILTKDRDGYVLRYKRLEAGVFKLPRVKDWARSVELRASELEMILPPHGRRTVRGDPGWMGST